MNLNKLAEIFLKFPGIGPRQAKRFVYFLAGEDKKFVDNLAQLILDLKKEMRQCHSCFRFFDSKNNDSYICELCLNPNRNQRILMAVEKDLDLENIERTGIFDGKYFVLGGTLPLSGEGANNLRFKELFEKAGKEQIKEVILATSATSEGENTNRYIERILEPLKIKVTRLGRGLSTGSELEYIDGETISNALSNRK